MRTYIRRMPVDDYETAFGRAEQRKAAKDYDCNFCNGKIKAGEQYINTFIVTWNGRAITYHQHYPTYICW